MTAPQTTEPTPDGFCVCNGPAANGRMRDCGIAAHRAEAGAPEPTPLERVAEALAYEHGEDLHPDHRDEARAAATALLAGDWLERVLHQHQVVKRQYVHDVNDTMHTLCTCDALVPDGPGYDFVKPFIAHQAAAVVAYATGGAA